MRRRRSLRRGFSRRRLLAGLGASTAALAGYGLGPVLRRGDLPDDRPKIIGHRGAEGLAPPNTLAAVRAGLEAGVDGIEIDAWETRDGELVLFHDAVLDWDSTGEGVIEERTWDEIRGATIRGEPIIRLPTALEPIADAGVDLYLELKADGFTERAIETVAEYGLLDRLTIISFNRDALEPARERGIPTGVIGSLPTSGLASEAAELGAEATFAHYVPHATPRYLDSARDRGLEAGIWKLVETDETLYDSLEAGPDVMVTNFPDRALDFLADR